MKHFSTNRLSTSTFSSFCVAFATADLTTFSISRVDFGLFVNFSVISASFTFLPRIKSTASRAFCGDMRINLLVALLIIFHFLSSSGGYRPPLHVSSLSARERELRAREKELDDQLFRLRIQKSMGQLEAPAKVREVRRDLARIKTILREKEQAGA